MNGDEQTKEQLLNELEELRRHIAELEKSENKGKRTKKAQPSSEQFYKARFENTKTATAILGEDDTILLANGEFEELSGYTRAEVEGRKKWTEFIARKDELERMKEYRRMRLIDPLSVPQKYEFQLVDRKGQVKDIVTTIAKIPGKKQTLTTLLDITDRKRMEAALSESERRLTDIIDFLPDPTFAIDLSGKVIAWNHAIEEMTGVNTEDILGKGNHEYAVPLRGNRQPLLIDQAMGVAVVDEKNFDFVKREGDVLIAEGEITLRGMPLTLWGKAAPLRDSHGNVVGAIESFHDITELKQAGEALQESEKQVRRKLDAILSPEGDIGTLELSDIIDTEKIQKLMDEFYRLTHIGIGIIDLQGRVLVGTGWQDICTNFHRVNPESNRLCIESDIELTNNVPAGTFKKYRCKNNMWDMATPIMLGDRHVGNIFLGQFLFDDEAPDFNTFRQQARRFGFNEQEYIEALERVPRWSRETVNTAMTFYAALAELIGNLSYSNIKLASALEERRLAEEALRKSEEKFRGIYEESPLGIELYDREGTLLDVNKACLDIFGISDAKEVKGLKLFKNPNLSERLKGQLLRGESVRCEIPYDFGKVTAFNLYETTKRGIIYLDVLITPLRVSTKEFNIGYLVHTRDITKRKQAEQALHRSEEILHSVFKTTPVGLCIMKDRVFQSVNEAWLNICGYSEPDLIGHTPRLLYENEEEYERVGRELYTDLSKRGLASVQTTHRRKDGTFRDVIMAAAPLLQENIFLGAVVTVEDITERKHAEAVLKESEEKYNQFFKTSRDCVFITKDGSLIDINDAAVELLGYASREELLRVKVPDLYAKPEEWVKHSSIISERGYGKEYPINLRRKDGGIRHTLVTSAARYDKNGNLIGFQGTVRDVTEQRRNEKELKKYREELEIMVAERTRELEDKTKNLQEVNTALNVLLKKRDQDKKNLEENFVANI
ncbi:MAG: PAS domain S-box protein, partial [Smithella sp.]